MKLPELHPSRLHSDNTMRGYFERRYLLDLQRDHSEQQDDFDLHEKDTNREVFLDSNTFIQHTA
jgi:hypothetical protein